MKSKKFIIICSSLILIITICLCINFIINNKDTTINTKKINKQFFKYQIKDATGESTETIEFENNKVQKIITIRSNNESINDSKRITNYDYYIKDNIIYIKNDNIINTYKYEDDCIYDTSNPEIKYCKEKENA